MNAAIRSIRTMATCARDGGGARCTVRQYPLVCLPQPPWRSEQSARLGRSLPQPDDVSPDYKTQASALLYGDPYDWDNLNQPDSIADYLRTYY